MSKANPLLSAFNAGEFSPRMVSRVALQQYDNALAQAENAYLYPQGGFGFTPGGRYIADAESNSNRSVLRRFVFSESQSYILEFCNQALRFFTEQGQITAEDIGASITNGTFDSDISNWTDQSNGTGAISHDSTNNRMQFDSAGSGNEAIAEQSVTTTTTSTEHLLRFEVFGFPSQEVIVRVGSSSGASDYLSDLTLGPGGHVVAFTPTASPFYIQFEVDEDSAADPMTIDDISLLDDEPVEITTPYDGTGSAAELYDMTTEQSADVMYVAHRDYSPRKVLRRGNTSWSLQVVAFEDGPYLPENKTATTLDPAALSGVTTMTASSTAGINDGQGFLSTDVGRVVQYFDGTELHWFRIIGINSTTNVDIIIGSNDTLNAHGAQTRWSLGLWSDTTGYPTAVGIHEERLLFGGSDTAPLRFDGSVVADFEVFRPVEPDESVPDDDAISFTIASGAVNRIHWFGSTQELIIGTAGGEWVASSQGAALTPSDIGLQRHTSHGVALIQPVLVGNALVFVQSQLRKVREFLFNFNVDSFVAPDLTQLADHITRGKILQMAYQQEPDSHIWCVRDDGQVAVLVYDPRQQVTGWSRRKPGGTDAKIESVATIPGQDGSGQVLNSELRDEVWVVVSRTINGGTKRYIEVIEEAYESPLRNDYDTDAAWEAAVLTAQADAFHVDSGLTYDGAATSTITGLDHLEGETVDIWADGAVHPQKTVSSGSITLDYDVEKAQVGLPLVMKVQTLKLPVGQSIRGSTAVGQLKKVTDVNLVLMDTSTLKVGDSVADLKVVSFREVADSMDTGVPLFTGEYKVTLESRYETDPRVYIRSNGPGPVNVLAIAPEVTTNDVP